MSSTNELIRRLARQFVAQHHPEEASDFDGIWELMPEDLTKREPPLPIELEQRFWNSLIRSPYITDIVINIVAATVFELGLCAGKNLVGLTRERRRRERFERKWGAEVDDPELVRTLVLFVYDDFESLGAEGSSQESGH